MSKPTHNKLCHPLRLHFYANQKGFARGSKQRPEEIRIAYTVNFLDSCFFLFARAAGFSTIRENVPAEEVPAKIYNTGEYKRHTKNLGDVSFVQEKNSRHMQYQVVAWFLVSHCPINQPNKGTVFHLSIFSIKLPEMYQLQ